MKVSSNALKIDLHRIIFQGRLGHHRRDSACPRTVSGTACPDRPPTDTGSLPGPRKRCPTDAQAVHRVARRSNSYLHVGGFSLEEVGNKNQQRLSLRGGLPRSFLEKPTGASALWRDDFVSTFIRRDIPELGIATATATLRRFWTMLAHYHAQTWNASEFARAFGMSVSSIRRYLDQLTSAFAIRQLQPWFANLKKRQVKSPKVYLSDSGLLHSLLGLQDARSLESHPKVGASWEGFMLEQIIDRVGAKPDECFFWGTHGGAELDLLIVRGARRLAFEFKRSSAPQATASMYSALEDLQLARIDVLYPGSDVFPLAKKIRAVGSDCIKTAIQASI